MAHTLNVCCFRPVDSWVNHGFRNSGSGHQGNSGWHHNRSEWLGDSGRQLTLLNTSTDISATDRPNTVGQYRFLFLNPGTYRLSVEMADFSVCEDREP